MDAARAGVKVWLSPTSAARGRWRGSGRRSGVLPGRIQTAAFGGAELWGLLASGAKQFSAEVEADHGR